MTTRARLLIMAVRAFLPPGWRIVAEETEVRTIETEDGRAIIGFAFRVERGVEPVDVEHLRRK